MEKRTEIILLTHGGWGEALVNSLKMIVGAVDCVHEIPLRPEQTLADYAAEVRGYAQNVAPGSLLVADLFGGTPSNVGAMVAKETGLRVFCGLNAPMLLEAVVELQNDGALDFDAVLSAGKGACKDVYAEVMATMSGEGR